MTIRAPRALAGTLLVAALSVWLTGCGEAGPTTPTGTVKGKVTLKGAPITAGTIAFVSDKGNAASAVLGADGSFTLKGQFGEKIPVDTYKVSVTPPDQGVIKMEPGKPLPPPPSIPGLDPKYGNHMTSGLTEEVKEGENTKNIDIP